jgi:hypothetical protein
MSTGLSEANASTAFRHTASCRGSHSRGVTVGATEGAAVPETAVGATVGVTVGATEGATVPGTAVGVAVRTLVGTAVLGSQWEPLKEPQCQKLPWKPQ